MVTRGSPKPLLRVRVLLPLPKGSVAKAADFFIYLLAEGLEEAVMNQAPVGPENGADRAAASRENPGLLPLPKFENPNTFFLPKMFASGFSFYVSANRK